MHGKESRRSALRALRLKYHRLLPDAHFPTHPSSEVQRLRGCINQFTDILALSANWSGRNSNHVMRTLVRALVGRLDLDFAYVRLVDREGRTEQLLRLGRSQDSYASRRDFLDVITARLESEQVDFNDVTRQHIGQEAVSIMRLGLESLGPNCHIVVGCRRIAFPDDIEQLILNVAADQGAMALQAARLLSAQPQGIDGVGLQKPRRAVDPEVASDPVHHQVDRRPRNEKAVEAPHVSDQYARVILENIPAFAVVLAPTGEIEDANTQILRYLGKTLDELRRWATSDIIHPDDLPRTSEVFRRSIESGAAYDIEQRLLSSKGDYRWFRASAIPLAADDGKIEHWYVVLIDIHDRKQAEEHLHERERQLQQSEVMIAEGQRLSQTGTFYWNTVTNELRFSDENCRINGLEPGTPVTMELMASRIHPDDQPLIQQKIEAGNRNDSKELDYEIRLQMPDKQVKWVHTTSSRFINEEGQLEYIGAVRDITERHNAEDALSKLRSELAHMSRVSSLGALTASIAHEVNQPLSGILTNASTALRMLSVESPNVSGALETVRRTIRDAHRASDVIARLRVMYSRKDAVLEEVQLNDAAQEVIALSLAEVQRNALTLLPELAENLPAIDGDRVQLQQVILNLLLNACDAMKGVTGRARHIVLKTDSPQDGGVQLTVVDSGTGIDPAHADRIFEPFFTTKSGGMGIGLSVSRSIIERHHGRLWAQPNADFGTAFSFSIPPRRR